VAPEGGEVIWCVSRGRSYPAPAPRSTRVHILCGRHLQPFVRGAEARRSPKRGSCRQLTRSRPYANVMFMRLINAVPALKISSKSS
jgi:hypothetical protein